MNYLVVQLEFDTAAHFGTAMASALADSADHFYADTLFSALCHTAMQTEGVRGIERLCTMAANHELILSDSMPWREGTCYLPKPLTISGFEREIPPSQQKAVKKMQWIPMHRMQDFCSPMQGGVPFFPDVDVKFGKKTKVTKAFVSVDEDAVPYQVGVFEFHENCGLYVVLATKNMQQQTWLLTLIRALGLSGIGGKTSSGYGKYHIAKSISVDSMSEGQYKWLYHALTTPKSTHSMLITTCLPIDSELDLVMEGADYQLVRRSGFIASEKFSNEPMKKRVQYFFQAGSVFRNRFSGGLFDVGGNGTHPVFRYSKPLFLGVSLQ